MFHIAVYGVDSISFLTRKIIEKYYNEILNSRGGERIEVVSYFNFESPKSEMLEDIANISFVQMRSLYQKGLIQGIIVPRELYAGATIVVPFMIHNGIDAEDIYITPRITDLDNITYDDLLHFLTPYYSAKYLPYLEFHVADHCNLNCKACEHYSSLVKSPKFTDLNKFTKDIKKLHEFVDDIGMIRILGGEPLLNPELDEYIVLARKLYPKAIIRVVTNALLLLNMPEHFFQTLKNNAAEIHISLYPPMVNKLSNIRSLLDSHKITYAVSPLMENFEMKQTLIGAENSDYFYYCFQARCHNLYNGKIAACFLPFTTKYFNQYFNQNLPEDGAIDLYDENLTTEELKKSLLQPFERCKYCKSPIKVKWQQVKNPSDLSDWVV